MVASNAPAFSATRRQFLGWSGALAATGLLAGCSGGSQFDTSEQLTFTLWGTGAEKTAVAAVVSAFAKTKRLSGNSQSYPQGYDTKMNTLLAAGTPPDAGYLTEPMSMVLASQNKLYNVLDNDGFSGFMPGAIHHVTKSRAVSANGLEAIGNWYNAAVAREAGVEVPASAETAWSWDDYVEAADKMTVDTNGKRPSEAGFNPNSVKRYGAIAPSGLFPLVVLLASNGVEMFDDDGKRSALDSAGSIEVLQALNDMIFEHRVAPNAAQSTALGTGAALQLQGNKAAMAVDGQWQLLDLNDAKKKGLDYNVGVLPTFGKGAYTLSVSGGIAAFQASNNREAAVQLLLALASPETCPLYRSGLWMPPEEKYYTDPALRATWITADTHPSNYQTAIADMVRQHPIIYPSFRLKNFTAISTAINGALTPMFTKKQDVTQSAKQLARQVNALMQGRWLDTVSA